MIEFSVFPWREGEGCKIWIEIDQQRSGTIGVYGDLGPKGKNHLPLIAFMDVLNTLLTYFTLAFS